MNHDPTPTLSRPAGEGVGEGDIALQVGAGAWDCHVHVFDAAAPVAAGHYQPAARTLGEIEALAGQHGIGHLVLVQPSVYGSDNRVLLHALRAGRGRHRGVAVVDADVADGVLDTMHKAGVRGVRFNLVSPVGQRGWPGETLAALRPKLERLHWHVQWYAQPQDLAAISAWHASRGSRIGCVLDHLAGLRVDTVADDPAWDALARLADGGAWLKLSGWYRLGAEAPYTALDAALVRAAHHFADRCVWGSDWPHTSFGDRPAPGYAALWHRVPAVLGDAAANKARQEAPQRLYA